MKTELPASVTYMDSPTLLGNREAFLPVSLLRLAGPSQHCQVDRLSSFVMDERGATEERSSKSALCPSLSWSLHNDRNT